VHHNLEGPKFRWFKDEAQVPMDQATAKDLGKFKRASLPRLNVDTEAPYVKKHVIGESLQFKSSQNEKTSFRHDRELQSARHKFGYVDS